jgi:hypothetical protein
MFSTRHSHLSPDRSHNKPRRHKSAVCRKEASLETAHLRHGDAFDQAYQDVTSLDQNNQVNRTIVGQIWGSNNPGEALMTWRRQRLGQALTFDPLAPIAEQ